MTHTIEEKTIIEVLSTLKNVIVSINDNTRLNKKEIQKAYDKLVIATEKSGKNKTKK